MAVPTIAAVSPPRGHTGGLGLIEITGSGFRTWVIPPPSGTRSGPVWPTVEVLFGGEPGTEVAVVSGTRLFVRAPPSPLAAARPNYGEGPVDLTVRNLNQDGSVVPGESVTFVGGYRYARPQLAVESDLGRLVRELVLLLRAQVLANVSISTHSDFDRDVLDLENVVEAAELPSIVLFGPRIAENKFFAQHGTITVPLPGGEFELRAAPDTDDLVFTLVGISDQKVESINLLAAARKFFSKNRQIALLRDPAHPELGSVEYDLVLDPGGLGFDPAVDQKSNLRSFSGSFVVRGFDHEDLAGFAGDDAVFHGAQVTEEPSVNSTQKDE